MQNRTTGYLVIAQNTDTVDYLQQAYALALNLKLTQSTVNNLSVCVDAATRSKITDKHRRVFDHVVDIPWSDQAQSHDWKIHNKWKYLYMTPYEETVVLDTDMIFPTDVSHWWPMLSESDVWFTTQVRTYRNEIVTDNYYRQAFVKNNLPNLYTAFFYFKKSELASEIFAMTNIVFQHWERFFFKYLPEAKPERLSGDVAYALAVKLLGVDHLCTRTNITSFPTFVHMKSRVQNIREGNVSDVWTRSLPTYYKSCRDFKIGNFQQMLPFHYTEKSWLTQSMITQMEQDHEQRCG
jgi:hypothetical protein